nr:zinc finger, CCHC-type [Tanacetum cinerariifolium]
MTGNTVKDMTTNFGKLDNFEGHDFRRWQKKMHFLLTTLKVVYVLTTSMPELLEDATVKAIRIRAKLENDDYICRGHILNGMSDSLFDVYTNVESAKELWVSLESKYMAEDSSSKKFLKDFKHTLKHGKDDLSLVQLGSHLRIEESLRAQDSNKGKGKEIVGPSVNKTEEGNNKNNKQNKGKKCDFKEHSSGSCSNMKPKLECWKYGKAGRFKKDRRSGNKKNANAGGSGKGSKDHSQDQGHVHYKRMLEMSKDDLIPAIDENPGKCTTWIIHETTAPYTPQQNGVAERKNRALKEMVNSMLSYSGLSEGFWGEAMLMACYLLNRGCRVVVRLPDPKKKTLGKKGIDCIFVGDVEHSKVYTFYVIELNDSTSINSIIESTDAIFDENRFSSVPRPKDIIPNVQEPQMDDHTDDVQNEIPEPQKVKRVWKAKSYDPRTYNEAMQSRDDAFWKEVIDDEIGSIMENNTWVLSDLPPSCKPLGCKWIFKRKMKVDGIIDKFKAQLVIQGFRQKEGIDYFDTYAPVARITTIRLLLALAAIHNLVIHQMDAETAFLNGDLDEEVYMKQPEGFVMPVDKTKKFLSSRFSMKDMGEADVILDCSLVSTPMDPVEKLKLNTGKPVDQFEYSRVIGYLMYAMTSTRSDIAYDVGRLSRFTSNPSRQHWKAITRVFKYLRGIKDYGLSYVGYPSVLESYLDASWINYVEDSASTSGWVFLLGGGAISWASKMQTCITGSTMESEFVALAAAGKEVEWLRNLIHEIPI